MSSLVSRNNDTDTLRLILEKLETIEEYMKQNTSSSIKKTKTKNLPKYERDTISYDDIHIFSFKNDDEFVNIALIVKDEEVASIIQIKMCDFITLLKEVKEYPTKKSIKFYDYKTTEEIAMKADGEWIK